MLLLAFTGVITYFDHKHHTRSRWLDFSLFFITGVAGTLLLLLWVAADHTSTPYNYNILWAFPANAVVAFLIALPAKLPQWGPNYLKGLLALMLLTLVLWIFKVQVFSPMILLLFGTLALRYLYLIRYSKL